MDAVTFFLMQHAGVHASEGGEPSYFDRAMNGLSEADMRARPAKGVNSIVWLLWHMARTEDASVNLVVVTNGRQVLDDTWIRRLGVDCRHIGTGMTDAEVSELTLRADLAAVRAYRSAVARRTREVVGGLPAKAWDEPVTLADTARAAAAGAFGPNTAWVDGVGLKGWQDQSRAARLSGAAVRHNAVHIGEAVTIRGLAGRRVGM